MGPKPQTPIYGQDIRKSSTFMMSAPQSLNVTPSKTLKNLLLSRFLMQQSDNIKLIELEPPSSISPHRRHKTTLLNPRPPINKTWETFGDQRFIDYLSFISNMVEYKKECRYFHTCFALIAHNFSINKLKNIFNITLS